MLREPSRSQLPMLSTDLPVDPLLTMPSPSKRALLSARAGIVAASKGASSFLGPAAIIGIVVAAGFLTAVQTSLNTNAGDHFGAFTFGCAINFIIGTLFLVVVVGIEYLLDPSVRQKGLLRFSRRAKLWQFAPGLIGVTFVTAGAGLAEKTGLAVFFIACVVGQLAMSTLLDTYGWLGSPQQNLSKHKIIALVLATTGSVVSVANNLETAVSGIPIWEMILFVILSIGAASLLPIQAAINRGVAELLPSRLQATLVSFMVGTVGSLIVLGTHFAISPSLASSFPAAFTSSSWWMYMGGPCGVTYIGTAIFFLRHVGAAMYFVALVCGQMTGSLVLDSVGFLGSQAHAASASLIIGVVLVVLAAIFMQFGPALLQLPGYLLHLKLSSHIPNSSTGLKADSSIGTSFDPISARSGSGRGVSRTPLLKGWSGAGSDGGSGGEGSARPLVPSSSFFLGGGGGYTPVLAPRTGASPASSRRSSGASLSSISLGAPAGDEERERERDGDGFIPPSTPPRALSIPPSSPSYKGRTSSIAIPIPSSTPHHRGERGGVGDDGGAPYLPLLPPPASPSLTPRRAAGGAGAGAGVLAPGSPHFSRLMEHRASQRISLTPELLNGLGSAGAGSAASGPGGVGGGGVGGLSTSFLTSTPSPGGGAGLLAGGGITSISSLSPARGRPVSLSVSLTGRIGLADAGEQSNLL